MVRHQASRTRVRCRQGEGLNRDDTIVAPATPPGRGGVGIVRISGAAAQSIAEKISGRRLLARTPRLVPLHASDGVQIDRGLALLFEGPGSFTGEDVVELHAHGSPVVLDELVAAALHWGARLAAPGEFSLRGYLNGRFDLAQAEAIADMIDAGSRAAARAAAGSLTGTFSRAIDALCNRLIELRVIVEASIDFPEEELDLEAHYQLRDRLQLLREDLSGLLDEASSSAKLARSPRVAIVGAPNAGKSSLLNQLTGHDAAIVTPVPGTTRDTIHRQIELDGVLLELVDTAGLRETQDVVEAEGIRRTRAELATADLVLLVLDGATMASDVSVEKAIRDLGIDLGPDQALLAVLNKTDLLGQETVVPQDCPRISALTGVGIPELRGLLRARLGLSDQTPRFLARRRHIDALRHSLAALDRAAEWFGADLRFELAAEELAAAQRALGDIVGQLSSDELLGRIFSTFCIGK